MTASESRVPDWRDESVPASQHNVGLIYVGKETLKRLWPLTRKGALFATCNVGLVSFESDRYATAVFMSVLILFAGLLSETGRCILEGCLTISAASAALEQVVVAPAENYTDMPPGSLLKRKLTLASSTLLRCTPCSDLIQ